MNIIQKTLNRYEMIIDDDPNRITWEDELHIKDAIISQCGLKEWIADFDIENLYVYELFDWDLSEETLNDMAYVFEELLEKY